MENFRCFGRIGEGAHGVVYHAQEIKTGHKVALKKIPLKRLEDGLPIQVLTPFFYRRDQTSVQNLTP